MAKSVNKSKFHFNSRAKTQITDFDTDHVRNVEEKNHSNKQK